MRWLPLLLLAAAPLCAATPARADDAPDAPSVPDAPSEPSRRRPSSHPVAAVEGIVGLGTPLGYLGASLAVSPVPWLTVHGGVGAGQQGSQIEAGARARIKLHRSAYVTSGLSWSTGAYAGYTAEFYWERAHFANLTLGVESWSGRLSVRPFVGLGAALGEAVTFRSQCPQRGCRPGLDERAFLFAGIAVGFGLF